MSETLAQASILGQAFEKVITKKFGSKRSPEPLIFSTGIKHLDALLGGGIVSSGPVMVTSTPETGKSTFAYQMAKQLHDNYENSITVYLDIEGSGGATESNEFGVSRIETFGLQDSHRFSYQPIVLDIMELFSLIETLIETKILVERKTNKEFLLFIIWDSIPSTRTSKTDLAEDPNKIIGLKGRQLSFVLDKYLPLMKFNRVFFLCIDQVRADIKIDQFAATEQTVGNFKNIKAATNIFSLQHNVQQWLFLSKTKTITRDTHYGFDGWILNIFLEKNKICPSGYYVSCVFNKHTGIDAFWSHFLFLSEMTYTEKRIYKTENKLPFPLLIDSASEKKSQLHVRDNEGKSLYKSEPFFKRQAKELYTTNPEFKQWFDYAVDLSCHERITNSMFKLIDKLKESEPDLIVNEMDIELEQQLNQTEETNAVENQTLPDPPDLPEDLNTEYFEGTDIEMPPTTDPRDLLPLENKDPDEPDEPDMSEYQSTF